MLRDASGTITTGGTAQTVLPANPNRRHLYIANLDTAEAMYVNFGVAAVIGGTGSIEIPAQTATGAINFLRYDAPAAVPDEFVSIIATTATHKFTVKWA